MELRGSDRCHVSWFVPYGHLKMVKSHVPCNLSKDNCHLCGCYLKYLIFYRSIFLTQVESKLHRQYIVNKY